MGYDEGLCIPIKDLENREEFCSRFFVESNTELNEFVDTLIKVFNTYTKKLPKYKGKGIELSKQNLILYLRKIISELVLKEYSKKYRYILISYYFVGRESFMFNVYLKRDFEIMVKGVPDLESIKQILGGGIYNDFF